MATRRDVMKSVGIVGTAAAFGGVSGAADENAVASTAQGETASVRTLHAVPDAPAIDLLLNDFEVLDDFSFKEISPYARLRSGLYQLEAVTGRGRGRGRGRRNRGGIDETDYFDEGDYTVVATGSIQRGPDPNLLVLEDDNSPVAHDEAKVRVVHLSPDAGEVNVRIVGHGRLARGLAFEDDSDYVTVPAGTVDLVLVKPGENRQRLPVTLALAGGATYSVFVVGFLYDEDGERSIGGEQGLTLLPVVDDITLRQRPFLSNVHPRSGGGDGRGGRGDRGGRGGRGGRGRHGWEDDRGEWDDDGRGGWDNDDRDGGRGGWGDGDDGRGDQDDDDGDRGRGRPGWRFPRGGEWF
ncbi:DUF4397 domain-containing protein [Haloarchaeobius sp. DFWS5]|uniref:DUF4397 domain-containing protein n=1 Tax=Haloarchaeobius sp. DFWS5 TaxID=3446114 RepID=UPI003EBE0124